MTYLVLSAFAVYAVHHFANGFVYPPTRRPPEPPVADYWPGYLHELETL